MTTSGARATTAATAAATNERPTPIAAVGTAAITPASTLSVPNKPMVPTAHAWFNEHPIDPMRRHMGRPLDIIGERPARELDG